MQTWRDAIQAALNKGKPGATPTTAVKAATDASGQQKDYQPDMGPDSHSKIGPSDFENLKVIGQGSFGTVVLCRLKSDGQIFAMKILNKKSIVDRGEVRLALQFA